MKIQKFTVLAVAMLPLLLAGVAFGQVASFDENGNGSFGPGSIAADPGPGGLPAVLTYPLPFAGTVGDVLLQDGVGGPILDVVRFNGNGTLLFYSDNTDGVDALADTPSPPGAFYANPVTIQEVGTETNNGALYQPGPGQPGFEPSFPNLTYHLISDVPEPATLGLLASGLAAFAMLGWSRRRRKLSA